MLIPFAWIGAFHGGWTVFLLPLLTWYLFSAIDVALGLDVKNADLDATEDDFYWYHFITMIWAPEQFITVFALIAYATGAAHLATWEKVGLFFGVGVLTGTIGIY